MLIHFTLLSLIMFAKTFINLAFALGAAAGTITNRAAVPAEFGLYAYGSSSSSGIGGLPVQYVDGMIFADMTTFGNAMTDLSQAWHTSLTLQS